MKKYAMYLRKSRTDEELERIGDGDTLARHRNTLTELAKRQKLPVADIYEEVVSGESISARPQMQKLLTAVEQGVYAGVLVMEVERLARGDTMDQGLVSQTFKYSDTLIITPTKTYDPNNEFDEEYFEFGLFMSRREYKTINRRLQRGRVTSVKEGKFVGSQAPYGYEKYKLPNDKGYSLRPKEPEATTVKMMYQMYTKGVDGERIGFGKISNYLNDHNIPAANGGSWTIATVRDMLTNPVYCGKIRWGFKSTEKIMSGGEVIESRPRNTSTCVIVDGLHEPLISEDVYNRVLEIRKKNPPRPLGEKNKVTNPLSGLIRCTYCGKSMQRRPYKDNTGRASLICNTHNCPNRGCFFDLVEDRIVNFLKQKVAEYYNLPDSEKENIPQNTELNFQKDLLKTLNTELDALKKAHSRICDAFEKNIYDAETYILRESENRKKQTDIKKKIAATEAKIESETGFKANFTPLIPRIENFLALYPTASEKEKNDILKTIIEKVEYKRDVAGRFCGSQDNFELTITPVVPHNHH